jgi:hypothetical protein
MSPRVHEFGTICVYDLTDGKLENPHKIANGSFFSKFFRKSFFRPPLSTVIAPVQRILTNQLTGYLYFSLLRGPGYKTSKFTNPLYKIA